jgi:hypothetical protein
VIVVRYADDFMMGGLQHRSDLLRFRAELEARLRRFHLELHPGKTRVLEFGRFAAENRQARGAGKPETFDFLGFTHFCGRTRRGGFTVWRRTMRKRLQAKLTALKVEMHRRWHEPVYEVGAWLCSVLRGHYQYYGVPGNFRLLARFRWDLVRLWRRALLRRSQRSRFSWTRPKLLVQRWLPLPHIIHPHPARRPSGCALSPEVGAQCGSSARWDLCGGRRATGVPTATRRCAPPLMPSVRQASRASWQT